MTGKETLREKRAFWEPPLTPKEKFANIIREMGATPEAIDWIIEKAGRKITVENGYHVARFKQQLGLEELEIFDLPAPVVKIRINPDKKTLTSEVRIAAKTIVGHTLGEVGFLGVATSETKHLIIQAKDGSTMLIFQDGTLHFTRH